jgi:hypothetical protein
MVFQPLIVLLTAVGMVATLGIKKDFDLCVDLFTSYRTSCVGNRATFCFLHFPNHEQYKSVQRDPMAKLILCSILRRKLSIPSGVCGQVIKHCRSKLSKNAKV